MDTSGFMPDSNLTTTRPLFAISQGFFFDPTVGAMTWLDATGSKNGEVWAIKNCSESMTSMHSKSFIILQLKVYSISYVILCISFLHTVFSFTHVLSCCHRRFWVKTLEALDSTGPASRDTASLWLPESRGCNRQSYSSESNIGRILKELQFLSWCIKTCPVKGNAKGICNKELLHIFIYLYYWLITHEPRLNFNMQMIANVNSIKLIT